MNNVTQERVRFRKMAAIAVLASFLVTALGLIYYYNSGSVTFEEMERIQSGMTKKQVQDIIGRPRRRYLDLGKEHWHYAFPSGPMFNGGFHIRFDDHACVEAILQ